MMFIDPDNPAVLFWLPWIRQTGSVLALCVICFRKAKMLCKMKSAGQML